MQDEQEGRARVSLSFFSFGEPSLTTGGMGSGLGQREASIESLGCQQDSC